MAHHRDIPARILKVELGCLTCVSTLLLWCLLNPTWRGTGYLFDQYDTHEWQQNGAFGITGHGAGTISRRSPLWDPPQPSGQLTAEIRWPLQPVTQPYCIEIDPGETALRFWLGLILIAGLIRGITSLSGLRRCGVIIESFRQFFPFGGAALLACGVMAAFTIGAFPGPVLSLFVAFSSIAAAVIRAASLCSKAHAVESTNPDCSDRAS